jgi:hypothetical protein
MCIVVLHASRFGLPIRCFTRRWLDTNLETNHQGGTEMAHTELRELLTEIVQLKEENRNLKLKMEERMRRCTCYISDRDRTLRDMLLDDATRRMLARHKS